MQRQRPLSTVLTSLAVIAGAATAPAHAQDVRYESVTRVELPGAAGTIMRAAARLGGGSTETTETTYISGQRMRTDENGRSTILDLENGRMVFLDHERRTYFEISIAAGLEQVREASARAQQVMAEDGRRELGEPDAEFRVDFKLDVQAAGQRDRIAGYDAERFYMTMQAQTEIVSDEVPEAERGGTFVVLTDIWTSQNAPMLAASRAFGEAASMQDYTQAASTFMDVLTEAFAEDPRFRVGFEQAAAQAQQLDGVPLKTTTRFIAVAPNAEFDRGLALGEGAREGPSVAAQAGRAALGRLARRATGAPAQQQQAQADDEPKQHTVLTVISELRNISTARVDPALFEVPADYRAVNEPGLEP